MRVLFLFFVLLIYFPRPILATTIESGQLVNIDLPLNEDLYVGANNLEINAVVNGDLIAGVRYCAIRDTIREDAIIFAENITIEAPILDDARLFGGQIHIRADIFGDLVVAGGTITIDRGVTIHGNLYIAGGTIDLQGRVVGEVELAGGEVDFNGTMEHTAKMRGENLNLAGVIKGSLELVAQNIVLDDQVLFYQDIRYWTEAGTIDFGSSMQNNSQAIFDESLRVKLDDKGWHRSLGVGFAFFSIARLLSAALLLLLLVWAFQDFFRRASLRLIDNYSKSLGYGVLYLLGMPLLILLALVTIIGIPVGLFSMATYGLTLGFAHVFTALLITYWWQAYQFQKWKKGQVILVASGIFVALKLISWIPIVGWLISFMAIAITFGAILMELLRTKREEEMEVAEGPDLAV